MRYSKDLSQEPVPMNIGKTMPITQRSLNLTKIKQPVVTPHVNKSFTFENHSHIEQQS